jgi:hypothetical protein
VAANVRTNPDCCKRPAYGRRLIRPNTDNASRCATILRAALHRDGVLLDLVDRSSESGRAKARRPHAARMAIPHHTTASAITMQAAVRAFSKADEAILMLSFAYPDRTLCDSIGVVQCCEDRCTQPVQVWSSLRRLEPPGRENAGSDGSMRARRYIEA